MALDIDRVLLQRACKLDAAARDIGVRGLPDSAASAATNPMPRDRLASATTPPARSPRAPGHGFRTGPRSTSRMWRACAKAVRCRSSLVNSAPISGRATRPRGGRRPERSNIVPDVGGCLPWRHQRTAVQSTHGSS